jgi:CheY-like chemotaxis protein
MAVRVLCADDEPVNIMLLEAILAPKGYEIVKACDGEKALDIIKSEPIDIALLDVIMPGMNGHDVCRAVKADKKCRDIPVIMLSGLSSEQEDIESHDAGADSFLTKPLNYQKVVLVIESLLQSKRQRNGMA